MRRIKMLGLAAVAAMSLIAFAGVSSAFATQWNPQGTNETANLVTGLNAVLTDSNGHHVTCNTSSTTVNASGAVATAITTSNPVAYSGCSNDIIGGTTTVTTAGTWSFTATSTSSVDATANNGTGGTVATISIAGICTITVTGPITIPGNPWSNTTHQLGISSATSFALHQSSGCFGAVGATGTLSGTYQLPTGVTIS